MLLQFQHAGRAAEMAALNIEDVRNGTIRLRRVKNSLETVQPLISNKNILFDEPKALAAWLEEHPTKKGPLFPSRKGDGSMRPDTIGKLVKSYMQAAGIDEELAHSHSLKHACLANLIRSGVTLEYVKQFAGHRAVSSTLVYLGISDSEATQKAQAAFQKLSA